MSNEAVGGTGERGKRRKCSVKGGGERSSERKRVRKS